MSSIINLEVITFSFLTSNTKHFLTILAITTAVRYLLVPLWTQYIC